MTETPPIDARPPLSEDDKARLHLWARATPAQRLDWLEESLLMASQAAQQAASNIPSR